jgi:N-sulfoglucosamine sulfohydrolase
MSHSLPNIVIITCHDLGRYLGCYGIPTVQTPNLDAFAEEAVQFTQAFCTAPQCSPSRSGIYTGRYPHSNGVLGLTHSYFAWDLHADEQHLGQVLAGQGYARILVGVHHESRGGDPKAVAERCGMDEFIPPAHGDQTAATAIDRLEKLSQGDKPFYLQVGFHEPHRTNSPTESDYMGFIGDYIEADSERGVHVPPYLRDTEGTRTELAELQGAIRYMDTYVGRFLKRIDELGLRDNTVVIFTTDHGVAMPRAKCSLYDPGIEVTLMVRYPERAWVGGRKVETLTSNIDIFPTILELLGIEQSERIQGQSFIKALDGEEYQPREQIFAELTYHDYYDPRRAIRTDRYKLIANFSSAPSFMNPSQSWRTRSDPMVPARPLESYHPPIELYDLQNDPWEQKDLGQDPAYAEVRKELMARLQRWMEETNDPILQGAVTPPIQKLALAMLAEASS